MKQTIPKGFTLVEIAIVLVVVGLLIGGVLKGQEMITNAKLKRIESDNAALSAAMFSYQDRYLELPGDDSKAKSRFDKYAGIADANVNGDGSGTIDGAWNTTATADLSSAGALESEMFFAHLRASGLISGGATDTTKHTNAYGGMIGIQDGSLGIAGHALVFGQIEGPIAKILEARLDDKQSDSGRIQSQLSSVVNGMAAGAAPAIGIANSGTHYQDDLRYNMAFRL